MRALQDTSKSHPMDEGDGDVRQAVICVLVAMGIFGVVDNYVGVWADLGASVWQCHLLRAGLALPLILVAAAVGAGRIRPVNAGRVALRSVVLAGAMLFYFGSLGLMPIASALAGLFSSPIWIIVFSVIFLRRRIGAFRISAILLGFAGVLLVLQPDRDALGLTFLFPMAAGVFYAIGAIYTRRACGKEDALSLLAGNFAVMGLMGAVGLAVFAGQDNGYLATGWVPMTPTLWAVVGAQAAGSLIAVYLLIRAYQLAETAIVGTLEYAVMIFGPAYAWIVLGQGLGPFAMLGLAAITVAAVLITVRGRQ